MTATDEPDYLRPEQRARRRIDEHNPPATPDRDLLRQGVKARVLFFDRKPGSERFRRFGYDDLIARDKASLDILWLRDESLEDSDSLPSPAVLVAR